MPTTHCSDHRTQVPKCARGSKPLMPADSVPPQRSLRARSLASIIALLLPILFSACTMKTDTFDSGTWKAQRGVEAPDNKRIHMVSALQTVVQKGMPRSEVIRLLGEPDSRDIEDDSDKYFLGLPMGPDEQYYEIGYRDGVVATLYLGQF